MNTIFVKDILRWNYFFQEKKHFYYKVEKMFDWKILFFLVFCLNFYLLGNLFSLFFNYYSTFFFLLSFFLLSYILVILFLYRDYPKLINPLIPLVFYISLSIFDWFFISFFLINTKNIWYWKNFSFLFTEALDFTNKEHQQIVLIKINQFINLWFKLLFVFVFCFLNKNKIIQKMQKIKDKFLSFVPFIIFIIFFVLLFYFYLNSKIISPNFNLSSTNQLLNEHGYSLSSQTGKVFFIFSLVIMAPIWEELVFRYTFFAIFGRKRVNWAIFFSVFWFAFSHYHKQDFENNNLSSALQKIFNGYLSVYLYMSFLLVFVYWFYNLNLIYPILLHWFVNFNASFLWISGLF